MIGTAAIGAGPPHRVQEAWRDMSRLVSHCEGSGAQFESACVSLHVSIIKDNIFCLLAGKKISFLKIRTIVISHDTPAVPSRAPRGGRQC